MGVGIWSEWAVAQQPHWWVHCSVAFEPAMQPPPRVLVYFCAMHTCRLKFFGWVKPDLWTAYLPQRWETWHSAIACLSSQQQGSYPSVKGCLDSKGLEHGWKANECVPKLRWSFWLSQWIHEICRSQQGGEEFAGKRVNGDPTSPCQLRQSVTSRWTFALWQGSGMDSNLVDSASSHTLVSKIKPCMSKYKYFTLKLRTAHYISYNLFDSPLLLG